MAGAVAAPVAAGSAGVVAAAGSAFTGVGWADSAWLMGKGGSLKTRYAVVQVLRRVPIGAQVEVWVFSAPALMRCKCLT